MWPAGFERGHVSWSWHRRNCFVQICPKQVVAVGSRRKQELCSTDPDGSVGPQQATKTASALSSVDYFCNLMVFCSFNWKGQWFLLRIFHNHAAMNHVSCKLTTAAFSILYYKIAQIPAMSLDFSLFFFCLVFSIVVCSVLIWLNVGDSHQLLMQRCASLQSWWTWFIRPPFPHHPHHHPPLLQRFNWLGLGQPSTPDVFPAGSRSKISVSQ